MVRIKSVHVAIFFESGMLSEAYSNGGNNIQILESNGDITLNKEDYELGMVCQWTVQAPENMVKIIAHLFVY